MMNDKQRQDWWLASFSAGILLLTLGNAWWVRWEEERAFQEVFRQMGPWERVQYNLEQNAEAEQRYNAWADKVNAEWFRSRGIRQWEGWED